MDEKPFVIQRLQRMFKGKMEEKTEQGVAYEKKKGCPGNTGKGLKNSLYLRPFISLS